MTEAVIPSKEDKENPKALAPKSGEAGEAAESWRLSPSMTPVLALVALKQAETTWAMAGKHVRK